MINLNLRERINQILTEPDISFCDWELGKWQLQNWRNGLPNQILALIKEAGYKSPEELEHYAEIMPPRKRPDLIILDE